MRSWGGQGLMLGPPTPLLHVPQPAGRRGQPKNVRPRGVRDAAGRRGSVHGDALPPVSPRPSGVAASRPFPAQLHSHSPLVFRGACVSVALRSVSPLPHQVGKGNSGLNSFPRGGSGGLLTSAKKALSWSRCWKMLGELVSRRARRWAASSAESRAGCGSCGRASGQ